MDNRVIPEGEQEKIKSEESGLPASGGADEGKDHGAGHRGIEIADSGKQI